MELEMESAFQGADIFKDLPQLIYNGWLFLLLATAGNTFSFSLVFLNCSAF